MNFSHQSGFSPNFRGSCEWSICMSYCAGNLLKPESTRSKVTGVRARQVESRKVGRYFWSLKDLFLSGLEINSNKKLGYTT